MATVTVKSRSQKLMRPFARDGMVMISAAEYDELIATTKILEAEMDFREGRYTECKDKRSISLYLKSLATRAR